MPFFRLSFLETQCTYTGKHKIQILYIKLLVNKGLNSEFYPNSGRPRTLLSKLTEPRIVALTGGAIGCFPGSSFKYFYKF